MKLPSSQHVFYLTLVLACGYANANSIVKRQSNNETDQAVDLIVSLIDVVDGLPFVGDFLENILNRVLEVVEAIEMETNDALGKFLESLLPITIDENGIDFTGLTKNGGIGHVLTNIIDEIPNETLPDFIKHIIKLFTQVFIQ